MPHLKKLVIKNSHELQIIDYYEVEETVKKEMHSAYPSSSSDNTSKISKSPPYAVLANLSCLRVSGCSGLEYLFPVRVIKALVQLEKLYIHDCSGMKMVIKREKEDNMTLPRLRILSLHSLGSLSRIAPSLWYMALPALEKMKVKECEKLRCPLNGYNVAREYTYLEWDNRKFKNQFQNRLYLNRCTSLKVIALDVSWNPSLVRSVGVYCYEGATIVHCGLLRIQSNLEELMVRSCPNLETIIEFEGENKAVETCMFGSSSSSEKDKLSSSLVFSNLTSLQVYHCERFRYLLPVAVVRNMAQLKVLRVDFCKSIEMIIEYEKVEDGGDPEKDKEFLPKLETLVLKQLPQLTSIGGDDILFDWPSLTIIEVWGCLGLKKLPLGPASVPKLKTSLLRPKKWLDGLDWEDEEIKLSVHYFLQKSPWDT